MVDRISRPIDQIGTRLRRFQRAASYGFRELSAMGTQFRDAFAVAAAAITAVAAAGVAALRDLIDTGMEFDRVMATVGARFGHARTSEEFQALEQAAIDASRQTGFTLEETAGALAELGAAGADATEAMQQLPIVLDTAAAASISLSEAGDVITDVMGAFELGAGSAAERGREMQRVADVMARGANSTSQSFSQLQGALQNVQTSAHLAGLDIETTTALIGAMADQGEKGERAGTRMSAMLSDLMTPSSAEARRALRRLRVETRDATTGEMRDIVDIVGDFQRAFAGMNDAARDAALADIFGADGMRPMLLLLTAGSDRLRELRTDLQNAEGATADVAQMMRDSGAGDAAIMNAEIEALKVGLYSYIRGPVREVISATTEWIRTNEGVIRSGFGDAVKFISDNMETLKMVGLGLLVVFGAIAVIVGLISIIFVGTFAVILLAFSAVVGAILYAAGWLYENLTEIAGTIAETFSSAWDSIVEFLTPAIEFIVGAFVLLRDRAMRELQPVFDFLGRAAGVVRGVFAQIAGFVSSIWASISSEGSSALSSLLEVVQPVLDAIGSAFASLGQMISGVWQSVVDAFNTTLGPILDRIGMVIGEVRQVGRAEMGTDENAAGRAGGRNRPQVISPQERTARTIDERTTTDRAEVTIRDETGRAQPTRRPRNRGTARIRIQPSGAM